MKHFLLFFFSIFISIPSFSQVEEELSQLSFDAINDTIQKYQFTDLKKALNAAEAYTFKGKNENDKEKEWLGMQSSILINVNFRKYELANKQAEGSLFFVRENKLTKPEMQNLLLLGDLQGILTTVERQLFYYNELLELSEELNEDSYREFAFSRIARVQDISGNSQKALSIYKKSLTHFLQKPLDSTFSQVKK